MLDNINNTGNIAIWHVCPATAVWPLCHGIQKNPGNVSENWCRQNSSVYVFPLKNLANSLQCWPSIESWVGSDPLLKSTARKTNMSVDRRSLQHGQKFTHEYQQSASQIDK